MRGGVGSGRREGGFWERVIHLPRSKAGTAQKLNGK